MAQAIVSEKGSIVIPLELREKYGIRPASRVEVIDIGGRVMILPLPKNLIESSRGMLKFKGSVAATLRSHRQQELRKDSKKDS